MRTIITTLIVPSLLLGSAVSHNIVADDRVIPSATLKALERFYLDFDGDNWINNEGWLDPEVDPCDWHGVHCAYAAGEFGVSTLRLPDNNLSGRLDESDIFEHVQRTVYLPNNEVHGSLPALPLWLDELNLSGNALSGQLPPGPEVFNSALSVIRLARNQFSGDIPSSWRRLDTSWLDLSDNQLHGSIEPAFAGTNHSSSGLVNLAGNRFAGEVPVAITGARLSLNDAQSFHGGGVNLCWNDLFVADDTVQSWLAARHVGGPQFELCFHDQRAEIASDISGSWYDPARSGEGVVMQMLPDDRVAHYSFSFDSQGRQHWLFSIDRVSTYSLHWSRLFSSRGEFGQGRREPPYYVLSDGSRGFGSEWRMDRQSSHRMHLERTYIDTDGCPDAPNPYPCIGVPESDRHDYHRLTEVAGTRCDNGHELQWISGTWFDPERNGEGFVVEVSPQGQGVVYWFTYRGDGSEHQAWMTGLGDFDGQSLHIEELLMPIGGVWGEDFDPSQIEFRHWGSLSIDFIDDTQAEVSWESVLGEFGSGGYPLQRLSHVQMAECEAEAP